MPTNPRSKPRFSVSCAPEGKWVLVCCACFLIASGLQAQELSELVKQLDSDDPFKIVDAIHELGDLGKDAESAIPALIQLFPDHRRGIRGAEAVPAPRENLSVSGQASWALIYIGKPSVPYLVKSLDSETVDVRSVAARTLGRIGHQAAEAVPSLVRKCDDAEQDVRKEAVKALGSIRARPEVALPKLLPMARKEPDEWVRFALGNVCAGFRRYSVRVQ